jgi:hypothetical protein
MSDNLQVIFEWDKDEKGNPTVQMTLLSPREPADSVTLKERDAAEFSEDLIKFLDNMIVKYHEEES